MRGYYGICAYNIKTPSNIGAIMRGASNFNAGYVVVIGKRYKSTPTDVSKTWKHTPLFEYQSFKDLAIPKGCQIVGVELSEKATPLETFSHPGRALYVFGPEDGSLPKSVTNKCQHIVQIDSNKCLNVAMAALVVMYDRSLKR